MVAPSSAPSTSPSVSIRSYLPSDRAACHAMFEHGMLEYRHAAFRGTYKAWHTIIVITSAFIIANYYPAHGFLIIPSAIALMSLVNYALVHYAYGAYVKECIAADLSDIQGYYNDKKHGKSHFWVAVARLPGSSIERVIGMVALDHHDDTPTAGELRRMSVDKQFRNLKVASKLIDTLFDFAKQHGYKSIYFTTSEHQKAAIGLYKSKGFIYQGVEHVEKLINLRIFKFTKQLE